MLFEKGNKMTAIIDYDAGNIKSVFKALEHLGIRALVTADKKKILEADHVILPGVGAFGDAMEKLKKYEICEVIHRVIEKGTPFLGICLGLQLLFESGEESPGVEGLSVLKGETVKIPPFMEKLPDGKEVPAKIPHMGWNSISIKKNKRLFQGIEDNTCFYFVHSYYLKAKEPSDVAAVTQYGVEIHAAVEHENVFACQFHPEKSGEAGLRILKNFQSC